MRMNKLLAAMLFGAFVLTGCATSGNAKLKEQTKESVAGIIKEGKTTKAEVQAALGDADSITFTDQGNEVWTYSFSRSTPKASNFIPYVGLFSSGSDVKTKQVIVFFKDDVVAKYSMRDTTSEVRTGIVH